MYYFIRNTLKENGYTQYEISNFALNGFESKHNLKSWEMKDYIGLGLGASSFINNTRYQNPETFEEYLNFANNFYPLWENEQKESLNDLMSEFMFLGLRKTKGVSNKDFEKLFGKNMFEVYKNQIEKFINSELLTKTEETIALTEKGMDISNTVMCEFV